MSRRRMANGRRWLAAKAAAIAGSFGSQMKYQTLSSPGGQVGIVRTPAPADPRCWNRPTLSGLPRYDPGSPGTFQVDLRSRDVSRFDVRHRLDDLLKADFDGGTRWPSVLPPGFDPQTILETAKNPGLRVRELHRRGITGQGIGVAVIDAPLLVDLCVPVTRCAGVELGFWRSVQAGVIAGWDCVWGI